MHRTPAISSTVVALVLSLAARESLAQTCEATGGAHCYYVATTGTDETTPAIDCQQLANDSMLDCTVGGTFASPWHSLAKAIACAGPGDFVYVRAGTYGAQCTTYPNMATYSFYSVRSGAAGALITFKAYPGENAILDAGVTFNSLATDGNDGDYNAIDGFEIVGSPVDVYGANDVVSHNHIHDVNFACSDNVGGIRLYGTSTLVEGNVVHDNFERDAGNDYRNVGGFAPNCAGIKFMHDVAHHVVRGNEIYNEPAGMHLKYPEGLDDLIEANDIHDVTFGVYGTNNGYTLRGNTVRGATTAVVVGGGPTTAVVGGHDVFIEGNTFVDCDEAVYLITGNAVVRDNIFASATAMYQTYFYDGYTNDNTGYPNMDLSSLSLDHNCYFTAGNIWRYGHDGQPNYYYDLPMVRSTYQKEATSVFGDPQFMNAAMHDYRTAAGSPCAGFGADAPPRPPTDAGCGACGDAGNATDSGARADVAANNDVATSADSGSSSDGGTTGPNRGGCGCHAAGTHDRARGAAWLAALALAAVSARRRRSATRS